MNFMNQTIFNLFYALAHQSPTFDAIISFIAVQYGLIILVALFIYLFEHEDKKKGVKDLFVVLASAVTAWFLAHFLKNMFHTLRPFAALSWVRPLVLESGYAFPSGHATFFMALASALWFYHKRLAVFFGLSAVLIGLARISAGIHWPVDILGGLALGYIIGTSAYYVIRRLTKSGQLW